MNIYIQNEKYRHLEYRLLTLCLQKYTFYKYNEQATFPELAVKVPRDLMTLKLLNTHSSVTSYGKVNLTEMITDAQSAPASF